MSDDRPSFDDIRQTLVDLPHGDPWGCTSYVQFDLFTVRHALIRALQPAPTSVFEFGALYGYFLVTALDALGHDVDFVGWVDDESHTPGSNRMCEENLMSVLSFAFNTTAVWWDVHRDRVGLDHGDIAWPDRVDLVAVDSDHTYEGALADLHAAHELRPRTIMIDDWTAASHTDDIQRAVQRFRIDHLGVYDLAEHFTVNGLAVLTRKESA